MNRKSKDVGLYLAYISIYASLPSNFPFQPFQLQKVSDINMAATASIIPSESSKKINIIRTRASEQKDRQSKQQPYTKQEHTDQASSASDNNQP